MKLDAHVADWLDDAVAWWLRELGPLGKTLVLPTPEHFPARGVEALFDAVVEYADLADWSFELVDETGLVMADPMENMPRPAMPIAMLATDDDAAIPEGEAYPVAYTDELARDPVALVGSFARSVAHYHLYAAADELPGGEEHRAAFADVGAVMLGFGVFAANTALRFRQIDTGGLHSWSTSTAGVLGEDALGYALALYVSLRDSERKHVLEHLAPNPRAAFKWACTQLDGPRSAVLARLRLIPAPVTEGGPYR